ncbi:MAG: 16S rRNA (cytosine(967)-C(5))-methyltransferase RsmB [Clostridiaceae bacterium]
MSNPRKVAVSILDKIIFQGGYSNIVLNIELKKSDLESVDKGLVTEIVYGTLKYRYTIDYILDSFISNKIKNVDKKLINILRSAVYQIKYLDKIPEFAAVNEAVQLSKKKSTIASSKFVNGVLRNIIRNNCEAKVLPKEEIPLLSYKYSFNIWLVEFFINNYGKENAIKIMNGLNIRPNVTVRVNQLKSNYDEVFDKLIESGYAVEEGEVAPEAIKIVKGSSIEDNEFFKGGYITVQDESAMLVAPLMDPKENDIILDLCSAPGGKTTHIAELINNKGEIKAFDIHQHKLKLIEDNSKRLGIDIIETLLLDATKFNERYINYADKVLIDVPCSGIGIIRKKPEIKDTKDLKDINEIIKIQRKIMENSSKYVKVGGTLLYSTCTINKDENENNIRWFLENFKNYKVENINIGSKDNFLYQEGCLTVLPSENMDGFFIAKLKRVK